MAKKFSDRYDSRKWRGMRLVKYLLPLIAAVYLLFQFVVGVSAVNGNSMQNTLQDGDLVLYTRLNRAINRGDIVSLSLPSGEYYVKRVVAVAGDEVDIREGRLYVNGRMEEAEYVLGETLAESLSLSYPCVVEEGKVFVLGDHRTESVDSRYFGSVSLEQITGIIRFRFGFFFLKGL